MSGLPPRGFPGRWLRIGSFPASAACNVSPSPDVVTPSPINLPVAFLMKDILFLAASFHLLKQDLTRVHRVGPESSVELRAIDTCSRFGRPGRYAVIGSTHAS